MLALMVGMAGPARAQRGFAACTEMFPGAWAPPTATNAERDLCKTMDNGQTAFAVRFDTDRKTPAWTAYRLTPTQRGALTSRNRPRFRPDPALPARNQARHDSYTNSGYSRGHLVPAHDMSWSAQSYDATFDLSNAVPQEQFFNAGTWLGMEDAVRDLAARHGDMVWVISGVYGVNIDRPTLGTPPHTLHVPKCFFKLVAAPAPDGAFRVLAVLLAYDDHRARASWRAGVTTLNRVRLRTGVNFFDGLAMNSGYDAIYWGVDMPDIKGDCM